MTNETPAPTPMPPDLSATETATLVGVSRARVYQRITGYAGTGDAGTPLDTVLRTTHRPGTRLGRQYRIPTVTALRWRAEREAQGLPVGPLPAGWTVPDFTPVPEAASVGMPMVRPF